MCFSCRYLNYNFISQVDASMGMSNLNELYVMSWASNASRRSADIALAHVLFMCCSLTSSRELVNNQLVSFSALFPNLIKLCVLLITSVCVSNEPAEADVAESSGCRDDTQRVVSESPDGGS